MTPVEQLTNALAQIETMKAEIYDKSAKLDQATNDLAAHAGATDALAALRSEFDAVAKERDELVAKLAEESQKRQAAEDAAKKLQDANALKPSAFADISNGTDPVESGEASDMTWEAALAKHGYVNARKKFPNAYADYMRKNSGKSKP